MQVYPVLNSTLQQMRPSEISQVAVCRICYSGENSGPNTGEPLISPCNCKGTIGLYHRTCLKNWLVSSNTWMCEICRFRYEIRQITRTFNDYLKDDNALCERKTLCTDILCFVILTPLVFLSVVVCISLAFEFRYNNINNNLPHSKIFLACGLIILSFILLIAYSSWLIVTFIFHRKIFFHWQCFNPDFEVINQLSAEESILINNALSPTVVSTPRRKFLFTRRSNSPQFRFLNNNAEFTVMDEDNLPQS